MFNKSNEPIILFDDRFSRCYLVIMFPIECDDDALKKILRLMAFRRSMKYDTDKKIYEVNVNNYTLSYKAKITDIGKNSFLELYISFPSKKSLGMDVLSNNLEFIKDIIYNPLLKDGTFDKKEVEDIISVCKDDIYHNMNNADFYYGLANDKIIDEDSFLYDPVFDNPELLDNITSEKLYNLYKETISKSPLVFFIGNVDENKARKQIKKIIYDDKADSVIFEKKYEKYAKNIGSTVDIVKENTKFKSSYITYNFKVKDIKSINDIALLGIVKCLLNSTKSRIVFDVLRTENDLVYKCGAYYYKRFGTMTIWASTGKNNLIKCDKLIEEVMIKISDIKFIGDKLPLIKQQAKDEDLLNEEDIYNVLMKKIDYYIEANKISYYEAIKDITPDMVYNFIKNRLVLVSKYIGVGTNE